MCSIEMLNTLSTFWTEPIPLSYIIHCHMYTQQIKPLDWIFFIIRNKYHNICCVAPSHEYLLQLQIILKQCEHASPAPAMQVQWRHSIITFALTAIHSFSGGDKLRECLTLAMNK